MPVEGIGEDFIPSNINFKLIDEFVQVNDKESFMMCRDLLIKEGIFSGVSSGSAVCGARSGAGGAPGPWAEQEQMASTSKSTNFIADGMAGRMA